MFCVHVSFWCVLVVIVVLCSCVPSLFFSSISYYFVRLLFCCFGLYVCLKTFVFVFVCKHATTCAKSQFSALRTCADDMNGYLYACCFVVLFFFVLAFLCACCVRVVLLCFVCFVVYLLMCLIVVVLVDGFV